MVQECIDRGELAWNQCHSNDYFESSEIEEKAIITRSLEILRERSGSEIKGWFGQDFSQSTRTLKLLSEFGIEYVVDFPNDDTPYTTNYNGLICIPNQSEDDTQLWPFDA